MAIFIKSSLNPITGKATIGVTPKASSSSASSASASQGSGSAGGSQAYTARGNYFDADLSSQDKQLMSFYQSEWQRGQESGNRGLMDSAHAAAEAIRAQYGYSGGADGSERISVSSPLPTAQNQSRYIESLVNQQKKANIQALNSAYNQNMLALDSAASEIPGIYQNARNQTAAQSEVNRQNLNAWASASGLGSGAGGQAQLSMSNALTGNLSALNQSEAAAKRDIATERMRLNTAYNDAIAQAEAAGDLQRAQLLYGEAVRIDESLVSNALSYQKLFSDNNYKYAQLVQNESQYTRDYALKQQDADFRQQQYITGLMENQQNRLTKIIQSAMQSGDFSMLSQFGYTPDQINTLSRNWRIKNKVY